MSHDRRGENRGVVGAWAVRAHRRVDESPASLEAVRQAARLRLPEGALHLFSADYPAGAVAAGPAVSCLLAEIERERATLVCVGSHGHSRVEGIVIGHVGTTILHEAPCSVLVAGPPADSGAFPGSIVVGIDGSTQADAAAAVASALQERFGSRLKPVAAS